MIYYFHLTLHVLFNMGTPKIQGVGVWVMATAGLLLLIVMFAATRFVQAQSCTFQKNYAYKAPGSPTVYYSTDSCTKRAFTRSDIFFTYFSSWGAVEAAPVSALKAVPNDPLGFMPYGSLYDPKYGALVKTVADPKVYLLLGGKKYWIVSEDVFTALGYPWNWIEDVDPRLLENYTVGEEITNINRHPNFTLIKYNGDPKVYRLEPGSQSEETIKRHIVDEQAFAALGFRVDRILTIPSSETYPDGEPLTKSDVPPPTPPKIDTKKVACVSNPNPVFTHVLVDPNEIKNIIPPPNIHKASGHLKTHSYIDTTKTAIPIYAPVDMELFSGAHYIGGPYSLDFRISCEVRLRLAHLDPVQKIKDALPQEAKNDSKDVSVNPSIKFNAGEVVGYIHQDIGVLNVGVDFGVYHSEKKNKYALQYTSSIYNTAVCPYDFFQSALKEQYRAKFNLIPHGGLTADGESFCQ